MSGKNSAENEERILSCKLRGDTVDSLRLVAALKGVSMMDLASSILRPALLKMEIEELEKRKARMGSKEKKK